MGVKKTDVRRLDVGLCNPHGRREDFLRRLRYGAGVTGTYVRFTITACDFDATTYDKR